MIQPLPEELIDRVLELPEDQRVQLADHIYLSLKTFPFATSDAQQAWELLNTQRAVSKFPNWNRSNSAALSKDGNTVVCRNRSKSTWY